MGLDLQCSSARFRVGSYGWVQTSRVLCLRAYAAWCRSRGLAGDAEEAEFAIIGPDDPADAEAARPLYDALPLHGSSASRAVTAGVNRWVDHSDCDGWHSQGCAADIAYAIQTLLPFFPPEHAEFFNGLQQFYQRAANRGESVDFC